MCVALPALVTAIDATGRTATVQIGGAIRTVDLVMTPNTGVGDWVVTHSGFAVRRISAEEAARVHQILATVDLAADDAARAREI